MGHIGEPHEIRRLRVEELPDPDKAPAFEPEPLPAPEPQPVPAGVVLPPGRVVRGLDDDEGQLTDMCLYGDVFLADPHGRAVAKIG